MKKIVIGFFSLLSFCSYGEEKSSSDNFYNKVLAVVDDYQIRFSNYLNVSATKVDSYFYLKEEQKELEHYSYGIFKLGSVYSTKEGLDSTIKLKLKYDLPYAKKNMKVFLDIDDDDFDSLENKNSTFTHSDKDDITGGLIVEKERKNWTTKYKAGVHLRGNLDPFIKIEQYRTWDFENDFSTKFKQDVFYYKSKGLGTSSNLYSNYDINSTDKFQMNQKLQYLNDKKGFEFYHDYNYIHLLDHKNSLKFTIAGKREFNNEYNSFNRKYWLNTRWRSLLYKNWLYLNVIPEVGFEENYDYKPDYRLHLRIDMVFGQKSGIQKLSGSYLY